jgi:hypothetical protein
MKSQIDPLWIREVEAEMAPHTSIHCRQAKILCQFAVNAWQAYPEKERKVRLRWLVQEAKRRGFNITFTVEADGISYYWKPRRLRFRYNDETGEVFVK